MKSDPKKIFKCKDCGITYPLFWDGSSKISDGRKRLTREDGSTQYLTICKRCHNNRATAKLRSEGKLGRQFSTDQRVRVAVQAEKNAEMFFLSRGYSVCRTDHKGPDLAIKRNGKRLLVEVKSVSLAKGNYRVGLVSDNRKSDDLICYVFSAERIVVRRMRQHLKDVMKDGACTVSKYKEKK